MRRVGKGGSPEIVVGPCDYSSSCSSAETSFRELDDVFLQTQARIWLGEVLHVRFDEETSIADLLADGELLFQVSKVIWKMLLKKHAELKHSKMYIHERASSCKSGGRYMPYPKVDSFLKICQILGLTGIDLFSPSDVVEKRDTRRVCMCVRSFSKKAMMKDLNVPDFDIVTYTIAMPTYMVGCIRRRLEQSWWSTKVSSGCRTCMDSKEVYRQRSLDSDYIWHHSSCSESDDAEDIYGEHELQSPASITSYDDTEMPILMGENSTGNVSVAEENFFTLDTQEQDDDAHTESVEAYIDTSVHSPNSGTTLNGNFPVTSVFCCESFPPCRRCQAHLDAITFLMHMEGGFPIKINNDTEIRKFDCGHSPVCSSAFMNLASEPDSCLTVDAKEEKCEASRSLVLQNGSVENFCSKPYASQESTKEKCSKVIADPPDTKLLNCTSVDCDTMESGHIFLLDNVPKKNVRRVLKFNGSSECNSTDLLDTSYENSHPGVHLMDSQEKTRCDSHNILGSDDGNFVNNIDWKPCTPALLLQSIDHGYSVTIENVADDQSGFHIKALNLNPGHVEDETMLEVGNEEAFPIVIQNSLSGNTVRLVGKDPSVIRNCTGLFHQFPDSQMPKMDGQIDLAHEVTMEEDPYSVVDEGTSISMCHELYLNGNGRDSISGKLCKLVVESTHLDLVSGLWHGSQSHVELTTSKSQTQGSQQPSSIKNEDGHTRYIPSTTDGDPHASEIQNCALTDNIFLGMSSIDSVSEELGFGQFSARCSESSSNDQPTNKHCMQFIDVLQVACDSSINSGTQFNALVSHNEGEFSVIKEQNMGPCAHLRNLSLSSDSFVGVHDSLIEEEVVNGPHVVEDVLLENLTNKDHESCRPPLEDLKQIPVNNFCMNRVELEHGAYSLGEVDALYVNEDTKSHQIAVEDDNCCSPSLEKQMLVKEWRKNQTADNQHTITEREERAQFAEPSKICCPCGICHEHGEPCTKVIINCSGKDSVQQTTDCTRSSKVTEHSCLTHNERVSGSLYAEESLIPMLNHLDANSRGSQEQYQEEVCEVEIHKMDLDMSGSACPITVNFSEEASVGMCHDHLNHTAASISIIRSSEITMASDEVGPLVSSYVGSINLETSSMVCTSENSSVHCDNFFSTSDQEFRNSYVQKEECLSCSTACVFEMKNIRDQSIELNDHPQPPMDESVNSKHQNDGACVETLTKDVGDGVMSQSRAVRLDQDKSKGAAASASKPGRKLPLKSLAGGMTLLGAFFLLLHFRKNRGTGNVTTSVLKLQNEKASHERDRGQDKGGGLYPPERLKF